MEEAKNFPTMIIPDGTEIRVNEQGQLSIRTPGNLVIQNSAKYSIIESSNGSVRIDPGVNVEAVSVQAADTCFVAGELTAWRVQATNIILEKNARANIMLQESERLELDRAARLVGNFASEKELYLMLGRFSRQLRELPEALGGHENRPLPGTTQEEQGGDAESADPFVAPDGEGEPTPESSRRTRETLDLIRVVLERELGRTALSGSGRQAVERLLEAVRKGDLQALNEKQAYLISQVESPSADLVRAQELLAHLSATGEPLSS